jgi:hypothetical protein
MSNARELAQIPSTPSGRRNLIINGAMNVAQRGASETGVTTFGYYACDRYIFELTNAGTWTLSQSTDAPAGFANSFKLDCTTADASLAAGDLVLFSQRFEGQDLQHLQKGTSSAKSLTASFWVKSSKTGTYILEIDDNDNVRNINKSYTINAANTWEYKTITFEGDTTGTLDNDNGFSFRVIFWLAAGSNWSSGTLATSWGSTTNANRAVGNVNLADSTSNEFYITGVQLEVGSVATEFEHRSYGEELALCQRYYHQQERVPSPVAGVYIGIGQVNQPTQALTIYTLPVSMRTTPTLTHGTIGAGATSSYTGTLSAFYADNLHFSFYFVSSGMVVGDVIRIYNAGAGDKITFDAEL